MSKGRLKVVYRGSSVEDGTIDVAVLAPSLLALGALVSRANSLANGDQGPTVSTRIRAHRKGSFEVGIEVSQSLSQQFLELLKNTDISNASEILSFLFGTVTPGLIKLLKHLLGRKPEAVQQKVDGVHVTNQEGDTIIVNAKTMNLYNDNAALRSAQDFVKPLGQDGMEAIDVTYDQVTEHITQDEGRAIIALANEDALGAVEHESTTLQAFEIDSANFRPGLVWRLTRAGPIYGLHARQDLSREDR